MFGEAIFMVGFGLGFFFPVLIIYGGGREKDRINLGFLLLGIAMSSVIVGGYLVGIFGA
jgi:hypothetical protein